MPPARFIQYGLGPIGVGIAELAIQRGHRLVAAVDIDRAKAGRPAAALIPGAPADVVITADAAEILASRADVVLHSTQSFMPQVMPQLVPLLDAGLNVISTCEELAYPWRHHPKEAALLDRLARTHSARIIGVGVNPGFVMDVLPVMLTAPCRRVDRISVERVVEVSLRRIPLQRKVGVGMTVDAFRRSVDAGTVGHVGLPQSTEMIAAALGWTLDDINQSIEPEVDASGTVRGLRQTCRGRSHGIEVLLLDLTMAVGVERPRDVVRVDGIPPITMEILGGIPGDAATWAIMVSSIPLVLASPPGLLIATQLPAASHALAITQPPLFHQSS